MIQPLGFPPPAPPWEGAPRAAEVAFATIWTTGPDPSSDRALQLAALRVGALGPVAFERVLRWAGGADPLDDDGASLRTRRELGLSAADLRAGDDPAEACAAFLAFLDGATVISPARAAFEAWIARLAGTGEVPLAVVGLDDAAALLLPGRLASEGERLTAVLVGRAELARRPRAVRPEDVRDAFGELVARVHALDAPVLGLIAHAQAEAHLALLEEDPAAAADQAFLLGCVERPSAWARGGALFAGGRVLADGVLSAASRAYADLRDAVSELRPAWGRAARDDARIDPLPNVAPEPETLGPDDRRRVDEILQEHLPRALGDAGAYRAGQHAVAARIAEGFGRRELLLVHAPTGTGKTLAYLVPAALWAYRTGVRVGVATFTRALQEQALDREVPLARALLARAGVGPDLRVTLLKGRENYLCWRALRLLAPEPGAAAREPAVQRLAWAALAAFALTDPDGDLDRMPRRPPLALADAAAWRRAIDRLLTETRSRSGCCLLREDREDCGGRAALRRAERAHVVVTNHAFVLARRELFRHVVFDECEHLHAQAHHAFSHAVPLFKLRELLAALHGGPRAPLTRAIALAAPGTEAAECVLRAVDAQERALAGLDGLQRAIFRFKLWRDDASGLREERDSHSLFREHVESGAGADLCEAHAELHRGLADLEIALSELAQVQEALPARGAQRLRRTLDVMRGDLEELRAGVEAWIPRGEGDEPRFRDETFYDVETTPRGHDVLAARVLLPHEHLGRRYFPDLSGAVLISATTWIQGGFDAQARYLGCHRAAHPAEDEEREPTALACFRAPDAFDYGRVLVCAPKDAPAPSAGKRATLDYLARFVCYLAERTRGRILVLFTNADDCARAADLVRPFLAARRIPFWHQRMEGAAKEELSERFRATVDSVLFGLDTFWYGADFPGETLEHLVIARLPFGVPDRYHHAQCAVLGRSEQRRTIYAPRALAKLRQGFGRLMRKETDRGTVFVLDPRVLDPRHRAFLAELPLALQGEPGARFVRGDADLCLREAFAHVGLSADLARRGLDVPFAGWRIDRGAPIRHDVPESELPLVKDGAADPERPAPSAWTEVQVLVPRGWEELVAGVLAEPPCTAVAFGRPSLGSPEPPEGFECLRTYLPSREDGDAARALVRARLARLAGATGADELRGLEPRFRALPPEDYATSWRKVWRPFRVGRLAVVTPGWAGASRPDDVRVVLEPLSSFGTGRHATTRACLALLCERRVAGARVLDAGTGSGLLAVAAARLGAAACVGFDVDPQSRPEAEALACANGVLDRCAFRRGGFETLRSEDRGFDVVLANLYADLVQDAARDLAARLAPGGWFAFSGCPADKRDATRAAIERAGLSIEEERVRGRWHTFAGSAAGPRSAGEDSAEAAEAWKKAPGAA